MPGDDIDVVLRLQMYCRPDARIIDVEVARATMKEALAELLLLRELNARLLKHDGDAQAVCDGYAKEHQQFSDEIDKLRAERDRLRDIAQDMISMLTLCGELGGRQPNESHLSYLRRLIDDVIRSRAEVGRLEDEVKERDELRAKVTDLQLRVDAFKSAWLRVLTRKISLEENLREIGDMHPYPGMGEELQQMARDAVCECGATK